MSARRAVVSGASIAGLSTAYWLRRTGWDVTIIERAPAFREGGQNVDVRGTGRDVLELMDLVDAIKAVNTTETGTVIVDEDGDTVAELPSDGEDGATAELEVLRGDFAKVLLDALPGGVEIVYGEHVTEVVDDGAAVRLTTSEGRRLEADLLVVAEGWRSSTRDLLLDGDAVELAPLGISMVFGTIGRTEADDSTWRWHNAVGGRQVHLRPDPHGTTRAMLCYADDADEVSRLGREEAVARLRDRFADVGWQAPRVLQELGTSDDVYIDYLTQVKASTWRRGRTCLTGDSAWCVTPLGGGGASLALIGGYVLAAHLSTVSDLDEALRSYEEWMRPMVEKAQKMPPGFKAVAFPQSRIGLAVRNVVTKAMTSDLLKPLTERLTEVADSERELPRIELVDA